MHVFTPLTYLAVAASVRQTLASQIRTLGTPSGCGQNTCCIPSCQLSDWSDSQGCEGNADRAGNCNNAFLDANDSQDSGVDVRIQPSGYRQLEPNADIWHRSVTARARSGARLMEGREPFLLLVSGSFGLTLFSRDCCG